MYFVYILLCDKDFFYVGLTDDLEKRLRDHTSGYSPYTKRFDGVELVYSERHSKRFQAEKREADQRLVKSEEKGFDRWG